MKHISIICIFLVCVSCSTTKHTAKKTKKPSQSTDIAKNLEIPKEARQLSDDDMHEYIRSEIRKIDAMAKRLKIFKNKRFQITWNKQKSKFICKKNNKEKKGYQKFEISFTGHPGNAPLVLDKLK